MFFRRRDRVKEATRDAKVAESQSILMHAAVSTAHLAQEVTRSMQRHMEDAIHQFVMTARIMNDGLLVCDLGGNIIAFNPAAQRMFNLPEVPVVKANELFRQNDNKIAADDLWKLGRAKKSIFPSVGENGPVPVHLRVSILEKNDGSSIVLLVIQDLSLIEHTFHKSAHAYVIMSNDKIVAANCSAARVFGYGHDELLGMPSNTIISSKARDGKPIDLTFELAKIVWEGEEAMLVTICQPHQKCGACGEHAVKIQ